ncbi:hypothetical protein [Prevotella dentasini]|uniref:hypothetical protein n=1 Tax=Prevotella dentasini TaxID=589537 RepID=UPI000467F84B|nr:hypothetical protein [Prevotella dentasini]
MRQNKFIAMSAAIALTFAIATPAQAQFGKLIDKAKKKAKEKVEHAVERAMDDATDAAIGTAKKKAKKAAKDVAGKAGVNLPEESTSNGSSTDDGGMATLHKRNFKPSKEAIANDPQAQDETVPDFSTRSYKQVHAAYEHLDPKYFPLQPYYKYPVMYELGKWAGNGDRILYSIMEEILTAPINYEITLYLASNEQIPELVSADGQPLAVQEDDVYRYPFAAAFFADPNSKQGVYKLAMILASQSNAVRRVRNYEIKTNSGVAYAKKGWMFPYDADNIRSRREDLMREIACNDVDINLINQIVLELYQTMEARKPGYAKVAYMLAANELYDKVMMHHKDFAANKGKFNKALVLYTKYYNTREYASILDGAMKEAPLEKVTLKPGALNASLNAQVLRIAKQKKPDCIRVVIENDAWKIHKNGLVITDRALRAWVVYKDDKGRTVAHDYSFCQDHQGGGKYGPLRYKGIGMQTVEVK